MQEGYLSRVKILTSEIEKLSEALVNRGNECAILNKALSQRDIDINYLQTENQRLQNEYIGLAEKIKNRTIEYEELGSQYNRLRHINIPELERKVEDLIIVVEQQNKVIQQNNLELGVAKERFIAKCQEVQDINQTKFHLENAIKQIKDEKNMYNHEYNLKIKEIEALNGDLSQAREYKTLYENALVDIELIRGNYSSLYSQRDQDSHRYNEQLSIQREMMENQLKIQKDIHSEAVMNEREQLRQEYDQKFQSQSVQLINEVDTLRLELQRKQTENQALHVRVEQDWHKQQQQFARDLQEREQTIFELNKTNQILVEMLRSTEQNVMNLQGQLQRGSVISQSEMEGLNRIIQNLNRQIRNYEDKCKDLFQQNIRLNSSYLSDMPTEKKPDRSNTAIDNDEKIKYLLKVIEAQNEQLKVRNSHASSSSRGQI